MGARRGTSAGTRRARARAQLAGRWGLTASGPLATESTPGRLVLASDPVAVKVEEEGIRPRDADRAVDEAWPVAKAARAVVVRDPRVQAHRIARNAGAGVSPSGGDWGGRVGPEVTDQVDSKPDTERRPE